MKQTKRCGSAGGSCADGKQRGQHNAKEEKKKKPFQKQSRAVTNCAPPNGCFHRASRCTDRARHAPRSRGLRISLLSVAKMLMAHLIRHRRRPRRLRSCTCGRLGAQSQPAAADTLIVDYAQSLASLAIR